MSNGFHSNHPRSGIPICMLLGSPLNRMYLRLTLTAGACQAFCSLPNGSSMGRRTLHVITGALPYFHHFHACCSHGPLGHRVHRTHRTTCYWRPLLTHAVGSHAPLGFTVGCVQMFRGLGRWPNAKDVHDESDHRHLNQHIEKKTQLQMH